MNAERFEQLISAYGADPSRWPQGERASATAFAARSPGAGALMMRADQLDQALDGWTLDPASSALQARILASAPQSGGFDWRAARFWWAGAGLAAACAMGVAAGASFADLGLNPASADSVGGLVASGDALTAFGASVDLERSS